MLKGSKLKERKRGCGGLRQEQQIGKGSDRTQWASVVSLVRFLQLSPWGIQSYRGRAEKGTGTVMKSAIMAFKEVLFRMLVCSKKRGKSLLPSRGFLHPMTDIHYRAIAWSLRPVGMAVGTANSAVETLSDSAAGVVSGVSTIDVKGRI